MLARLAVLRDTGLKLTRGRRNIKDNIVRLRRPRDRVLDEVTMARCIDGRGGVLARLELPQRDVGPDSTLTLSLQVVFDSLVQERALAKQLSFLLKLLNRTLVNAVALGDGRAHRRRLARVDVTKDNNVDASLLLGHLTKDQVM